MLEGRAVPYSVRRNARARKIWIKVEEPHGVVVVLPRWGRLRDAPAILSKHSHWVLHTLDRHQARRAQAPPPFGAGSTVFYRGRPLPLALTQGRRPRVSLTRRGFVVAVPLETTADRGGPTATGVPTADGRRPTAAGAPTANDEGRSEAGTRQGVLPFAGDAARPAFDVRRASAAAAALSGWYRRRAATVLARRVALWAPRLGVSPARITVRDAKTRWGSCSPTGALSFSWRLLMAPPAVLDYVVVHELCHLKRADHSSRFWALVESHCPLFRAHRKWLRENAELLRG